MARGCGPLAAGPGDGILRDGHRLNIPRESVDVEPDETLTLRPDLSPANAPEFLRAAGFEIEASTGHEVRGHVEAGARHHTPWGVVHGGLYATLIESACTIGASLAVAGQGRFAVGLSNHTEFIRSHREGRLDVRARAIHQGRTGQLWECDVTRGDGKLVARGQVRLQNVPG